MSVGCVVAAAESVVEGLRARFAVRADVFSGEVVDGIVAAVAVNEAFVGAAECVLEAYTLEGWRPDAELEDLAAGGYAVRGSGDWAFEVVSLAEIAFDDGDTRFAISRDDDGDVEGFALFQSLAGGYSLWEFVHDRDVCDPDATGWAAILHTITQIRARGAAIRAAAAGVKVAA